MLGRRRWLAVLVPLAVVALVEVLSDTLLDEALPFPGDTLLVLAVVSIVTVALAVWAFRWIDRLTGELARRNAELEHRDATLGALHRLSLAITATTDVDRVLRLVVDQAVELLPADAAVLSIEGTPTSGRVTAGDAALFAGPDANGGASPLGAPAASRLVSPLQRGSETIGSLTVASRAARVYGADEVETLASLANQAAIALEQARLQERLRELAVTEERERIAREMHDGLAQVLGYVNTKSQAVEHLLDTDRVNEARVHLDQLASAARSIYVDVREAILGLRSSIDPASGLVTAIETYALRFAEASKLAVEVDATAVARTATLADGADDEVFRIVQEALTNVRKHARAGRITVRVSERPSAPNVPGSLVIEVVDDGIGMGAGRDEGDWPRYGLAAMRERAAQVGGTIEWSAGPSGGTTVRIGVPVRAGAPTLAGVGG